MKKTISLILFAALALSMLSAGSEYLDSGISISKGDRAFVFQDIENPSSSIEYLVMNLPSEGGFRNIFSNEIAVSFPLNVYERIGSTTTDNRDFYPISFPSRPWLAIALKEGEEEAAEQETRSTTTKEKAITRRVLFHFIPLHPISLRI